MAENENGMVLVSIVLGSKSDDPTAQETAGVLDSLGIGYEIQVLSAHRTPRRVMDYARDARGRGIQVLIALAGGSAALPGVLASWTTIPVIGVPLTSSDLRGVDSLYAITQMPPGVPVACVAMGSWGARNAAYLAAGILALNNPRIAEAYDEFRSRQAEN